MNRRDALAATATGALQFAAPQGLAQTRRERLVLGMALEPSPGLDPTSGAASAIGEVVLYNIFETLTKINPDGSVSPLLAESWEASPDLKTCTFRLKRGVRFQNGEPFTAATVKFSFDRAGAQNSINKDKRTFASLLTRVVDDHTVVLINSAIEPDLPFLLGQASAAIVEPKSADTNATRPIGTGPYQLQKWNKGLSITLAKWDGWRNANAIRLKSATIRFIPDPAAQVAALLAGDVDVIPRVTSRAVPQFLSHPGFQVLTANSRAKTVLAINNRRKPLDDVRVRRAIAAAIDRKAVIQGAAEGYGVPIGSYYVPGDFGYIDLTGVNPYDPEQARALLKAAGVNAPLELTITLPPPTYARQAGEVIVSQLAKAGIQAKLENVEWANWLSSVYGGAHHYDLTIVSHAEPFDLDNFDKPDYYWGYSSPKFKALYGKYRNAQRAAERRQLVGEIQRLLAEDAVLAYLYQPQWVTIAVKGLKGLWKDMPIFANDLSALSWG
ncbi:MAG: ABC transporter substrate-binding protein [Pseudomonadota bacterium]